MSQERSAGMGIFVRVLSALLLSAALVCGSAPRTAGQTGGGLIAFEADGAIYVLDSGGTVTEVVGNAAGVNMQPALSPDASRIAFSSQRDGKFSIYVVNVDGSGLRRVTNGLDHDSEPAWSPDGTRLAFVRGFDPTGSGVIVLACQLPGDIIVVGVDNSGLNGGLNHFQRPIEVNLTNGSGGTDPAWSPDGTRIAFSNDPEGIYNYDIYTMSSVDGSDVHRLTWDATQEADPVWSPDGSWIAYTSALTETHGSECGNMPIAGAPTNCRDDNDDGTCDDQQTNLFSSEGPFIYRMAPDGSQQKRVTGEGGAAEPAWSPDGSQILFTGGPKGKSAQLNLVASDGTGPTTPLTSDPVHKSSPSWSGRIGR